MKKFEKFTPRNPKNIALKRKIDEKMLEA